MFAVTEMELVPVPTMSINTVEPSVAVLAGGFTVTVGWGATSALGSASAAAMSSATRAVISAWVTWALSHCDSAGPGARPSSAKFSPPAMDNPSV